jgi:hypothetical protein
MGRNVVPKAASVKAAIERELKLAVAAGFHLPSLKGLRLPSKILTSVYSEQFCFFLSS